jgi:hypothetical protein
LALFGGGKGKNQAKQKPTTQTQIPIAEVRNGIVILKNGGLRLVMLCSTVNFDLKSEEEQNAIISGYQSFINSLEFPIQLVIQSRNMDLSRYLEKLENLRTKTFNSLLQLQIQEYINFINIVLKKANIMDKKFYIVIPYELPLAKKQNFLENLRENLRKEQSVINLTNLDKYQKELTERARIAASGLSGLGLRAVQLNTQELVELFYSTYNPETARTEKLGSIKKIASSPQQNQE